MQGSSSRRSDVSLQYVLHRVLYPQVHVNGIKKKQTMQ